MMMMMKLMIRLNYCVCLHSIEPYRVSHDLLVGFHIVLGSFHDLFIVFHRFLVCSHDLLVSAHWTSIQLNKQHSAIRPKTRGNIWKATNNFRETTKKSLKPPL